MLLISARHLVMLYICAMFHEIILNGIKVIERTRFLYEKLQRGIIPQKCRRLYAGDMHLNRKDEKKYVEIQKFYFLGNKTVKTFSF